MAKLSPDTKRKLTAVVNVGKTIFHWSFIPTVLYLGKSEIGTFLATFRFYFHKFHTLIIHITYSL